MTSTPGPWGRPSQRMVSRLGLYLWLGVMVLAAGLIYVLDRHFPSGDNPYGDPYQIQTLGMLALVSSGLLFVREIKLRQTVRNVLIWVAVGGVLIIGFSYQHEIADLGLRLRSNLVPGYPVQTGPHEMVISEDEGGGYHVYGTVNGQQVRFLVDTGASDIVLSPADARRLGVDFSKLTFDHIYESANGIGHGATTEVGELSVGDIRFANVQVAINGAEMSSSLLGMAFLKRLKSYSFSGGNLILKW
ncbi:MAG TPA: TIGR02281 family clan AA aspartic protease [Rhizomicrobium sp.]|nr:TIGR02281 family clan AA aspartic protease [Rhizomicrobium sp.]